MFGVLVNPRLHVKINLTPISVLRFSAGRGMRVANVFAEHAAALASNRVVVLHEAFKPEVAWNYGTSLTHKFKLFKRNATFVADYFYTHFENQIVADLDMLSTEIHFYNLKGLSYSHSAQAEWIYEPVKQFEVRLAYKWQDVRTTYHGILMERPLVARSRVLFNTAYSTRFEKWKFDYTLKWFDQMRIPAVIDHGSHAIAGRYSPDYFVHNMQVTRKFKQVEWYVGGENLFDFMQHHQIVDAANPFGPNFDASLIWGPIMGRVWYTGIRLTIK
jgi:outer membrane receptor protein involved in Fe transport